MNMIPSNSRRPVYYEQFGPSAVRDVARPTRRQTIMPSYGQQSTPQLGRQQQFAGPPSGGMIPRIPIGMAGSNVLAMGVPGSVTDPQITAELQRRDAMDGREKTQRVIGLIDQNSANQRDVQDMRRVIGGVPGAQTPQGYAAPLSNNGSQVADYTGSMGAFRTDEQRRADRDMANQAMRWQANREADMMSGDLRQRMQRAYGGGDIPVGPPQVRTDGTVMVGNRFMEVPSNMIPVNNSMASYQRQEGGYSDRATRRFNNRMDAQDLTREDLTDRRASYMADVNGNSERNRQMRRAERMGLISRGTATPVRGRTESGNMIPSVQKPKDSFERKDPPSGLSPAEAATWEAKEMALDITNALDEHEGDINKIMEDPRFQDLKTHEIERVIDALNADIEGGDVDADMANGWVQSLDRILYRRKREQYKDRVDKWKNERRKEAESKSGMTPKEKESERRKQGSRWGTLGGKM